MQSAEFLAALYKALPSPSLFDSHRSCNRESCLTGADSGSVPFLRSGQEIARPMYKQSSDDGQGACLLSCVFDRDLGDLQ